MTPRLRYQQAHYKYQCQEYPSVIRDNHYTPPKYPNTRKANGLTQFVINYLLWKGHRATGISSAGRLIDAQQKQQSGISLITKKFIPGRTRKGSADVSSTIKIGPYGVSVMWEIKVAKDKASEHQLREQALEQAAGGFYFFTHTPEEFFFQYDSLFVNCDSKTIR